MLNRNNGSDFKIRKIMKVNLKISTNMATKKRTLLTSKVDYSKRIQFMIRGQQRCTNSHDRLYKLLQHAINRLKLVNSRYRNFNNPTLSSSQPMYNPQKSITEYQLLYLSPLQADCLKHYYSLTLNNHQETNSKYSQGSSSQHLHQKQKSYQKLCL